MRKIGLVLALLVASVTATFAQQIAYVDAEYVSKHIPEYVNAQKQLDELSTKWQNDVDNQFAQIEKLYQAYQNDQELLNADMRRRREDEIVNKEKEVKEYQRQKFGFEGELFQQRTRLIDPIQAKVSKAIKDVATAKGLDLILDKADEGSFLYANPKLDISNEIVTKLGLKPNPALAN